MRYTLGSMFIPIMPPTLSRIPTTTKFVSLITMRSLRLTSCSKNSVATRYPIKAAPWSSSRSHRPSRSSAMPSKSRSIAWGSPPIIPMGMRSPRCSTVVNPHTPGSTSLTPSILLISSMSLSVKAPNGTKPIGPIAPGITLMLSAKSASSPTTICSIPLPTEIRETIAAIPTAMPRSDRKERALCCFKLLIARRNLS